MQTSATTNVRRAAPVVSERLWPGLAVSALVSTILLIGMGGIVRVTGHGLGCPDWPLCYGRVIPPALTGAWVEFTHRVLGALTGVQIGALGTAAWLNRERAWVFWPAVAAVAVLAVQVVLGGLHVIFEIPPLTGLVHTGTALVIVGLLAVQVSVTAPAARRVRARAGSLLRDGRFFAWLSFVLLAAFLLLLSGSYVTRSGASLACPSFPGCGASVAALGRLVSIQMLHRYSAYAVAALLGLTVLRALARSQDRSLKRFALALGALLLVQGSLGIANVLLRLPMWSRVLHLSVGSALWAGLVGLWSLRFACEEES